MEQAQRPGRAPAPARLVAGVVNLLISKAFSPSRGHVPPVRERGRLSRSAAQIAAARAASNATRPLISAFLRVWIPGRGCGCQVKAKPAPTVGRAVTYTLCWT